MNAAVFPDTTTGTDVDLDLSHVDAEPAARHGVLTAMRRPRQTTPIVGMTLLCLASALLGVALDHRFLQPVAPEPKIAFAQQGAVVLETLLGRPDLDADAARRLVGRSLSGVIEKYQQAGYLVMDVTYGADGQILVDAVPRSAVDITPQMRSAVAQAISHAASASTGAFTVTPVSSAAAGRPRSLPAATNDLGAQR